MPSVNCTNCGEVFDKRVDQIEKYDNHFCDKSCMGEFQSKSGTEVIACDYCENNFTKRKSLIARSENDFCSERCHADWRSENLTGDKNYNYIDTSNVCEWCGEEYHVKKNEQEKSRFCCLECKRSWMSENRSGEGSIFWKGGSVGYRGESWNRWRKKIRERDENICQNCGEESTGKNLDVHHIVPVREFETPDKANFEENLCQLCDSCHTKFDNMDPIEQKRVL